MVRHIVMWKLKPEAEGNTAAENGKIMKERLEALVGVIDGLKSLEVNAGFSADYNLCLISEHTDKGALNFYQGHPEHLKVREFVHKVIEARASFDCEI